MFLTLKAPGFFSGYGATAIRDAPYAGLYVLIYEKCKASFAATMFPQTPLKSGYSAGINLASGVLAGGIATFLTNPFDVIKTRIQVKPKVYRNLIAASAKMAKVY